MTEYAHARPVREKNTGARLDLRIHQLDRQVQNSGIQLTCSTDFKSFREACEAIPETGDLTAVFDDRRCDIGPDNGFWIKANDQAGKIVHLQAARLDDLSGTTLARHWRKQADLFAPAGYDIDINKSDFDTAPAAHKITGKVCYRGDYWLDVPYRNMTLPLMLSCYASLQALRRYSPDYIYSLMQQRMVERGWAVRAGFLHIHPWAPRWNIRGKSKFYDEYFAWVGGPELEKLWTSGKRDIDILGRINIDHDNRRTVAQEMTGQ